MPGLIGSQGVRPGALNMNRVFRALRYRTEQAQYVTYHRPPIYGKDNYGVSTGVVSGSEMLMPNLPAIIRPAVTADYQIEKAGGNIIGAARVYTPNLETIKNMPNFDQDNNTDFNEIEGWDRLIVNNRTIYSVPTSGTTGWASGTADMEFTSDGQTITATFGDDTNGTFHYSASAQNVLEADRLRFQIKGSGASNIALMNFSSYQSGTTANDKLTYTTGSTLTIPTGSWLTVDVPFGSGSIDDGTSVYKAGTRTALTMASGSAWNEENPFERFELSVDGTKGNTVMIRGIEYYKSISWHVHSLKDMTDGYIIFNCVRTKGRRDSLRRAYG